MFLTKIQSLSGTARVLKISLIGIVGQSWYDAEDESVTELVRKIEDFNAVEGDEIHGMINSRGGNYFAGVHLYNALKESKAKVITKNVGLAASAASVVFMAGDVRICYPGSITMAHNPLISPGLCNSEDLIKLAADLDDVGLAMKSLYLAETGLDEPKLDDLLKNEKSMPPAEALEMGFATEVSESADYQAITENIDANKEREKEISARFKPKEDSKNEPEAKVASADLIISCCSENDLGDLVAIFHAKNFTECELNDSISGVKAIKDVCAASNVNFDDVKEHIFDQEGLLKAFVTNVIANKDDDIDSDSLLLDKENKEYANLDTNNIYS